MLFRSLALLTVKNLTVRYGALTALADMSWQVEAGEILGIIGPNGAGKSSCFAAVTHAVRRDGEVRLEGQGVTHLKTHELARLGLRRTFQQNAFFGELTISYQDVVSIVSGSLRGKARGFFTPWEWSPMKEPPY